MTTRQIRIGSRGSELALWQARWVQARLTEIFPDQPCVIQIIRTKGDKILDAPLARIGDKGLFTREIEHALLADEIDLAVHSLKDLPTELPPGLALGAVTEREDVRDVFLPRPGSSVHRLQDLAAGAVVATGSLRRTCQLKAFRPDLQIVDIRGNLNTRYAKLSESAWAGMMLARAGVLRLGWADRIGEEIPLEVMLPAVGQGALGVETREGDDRIAGIVRALHHVPSAFGTAAERSLLRHLEGGCQIPIGAFGRVMREGGTTMLQLDAMVGSLDGTTVIRGSIRGLPAEAEHLGVALAGQLLRDGARSVLDTIRRTA
jgi:hydroxymethylbilane synthase